MTLQLSVTESTVNDRVPWSDDLLNREEIAARLVDLLQGQRSPLRVSVDGGWGCGKTFFLKRLHATLEDRGCKVCYVDVSQSDFTRSHLTTLLNSVRPWLDSDMGFLNRAWHKVFRFFKRRQSEQTTLGLNFWLLTVQHEFGYSFDDDDRMQDTLRAFKGQLEQVALRGLEKNGLPTLVIIDELDRCRPGYALEVLQAVKHLFDVPGVTFIFGINRSELVESLKLACGNIDVETYLQKFFDLSFSLPQTGLAEYTRATLQKYDVEAAFGIDDDGTDWSQATHRAKAVYGDWRTIPDFLPMLCAYWQLSLREIDYVVRLATLYAANMPKESGIYPWSFFLILALKLRHPDEYRELQRGDLLAPDFPQKVLNLVDDDFPKGGSLDLNTHRSILVLDYIEAWLACVFPSYWESLNQMAKEGPGSTVGLSRRTSSEAPNRVGLIIRYARNIRGALLDGLLVPEPDYFADSERKAIYDAFRRFELVAEFQQDSDGRLIG